MFFLRLCKEMAVFWNREAFGASKGLCTSSQRVTIVIEEFEYLFAQ